VLAKRIEVRASSPASRFTDPKVGAGGGDTQDLASAGDGRRRLDAGWTRLAAAPHPGLRPCPALAAAHP
jgi:hypothetical protein